MERSTPADVELVRRSDGRCTWLFALNHGATPVRLYLDAGERELLGVRQVHGGISLDSYGVAIIEAPLP